MKPPPVRPLPPPVVEAPAAKGWGMVATHAGDLDEASKWNVVGAACQANDMFDVAQAPTFAEAVRLAWINFGGYNTLFYRIQDLAQDLRDASTVEERQSRLGVFVVCESV